MGHSADGAALVSLRRLRLALAAAMLAELVECGRLVVADGRIKVVHDEFLSQDVRAAPMDVLGQDVLNRMAVNWAHRDVREWLAFLALTAEDDVGRRLLGRRLVRRRRSLIRQRVRWPAVDPTADAKGVSRLGFGVSHRDLPVRDVVLSGLVLAVGLDRHVFWDIDDSGRDYVRQHIRELADPSYQELIHHLEAATTSAVAIGRT